MTREPRLTPHDLLTTPPPPPRAARVPHERIVHGTPVHDPYDWLRDPDYPDVTDERVLEYLRSENDYFAALFEPHRPLIDRIHDELRARIREDDESVPVRDGQWYHQSRFGAGDEYRVHYRRPIDRAAWEVVLDERELAAGHDYFRLGGMDVSDDSLLAFSTDVDGDERYTLRFRDLTGAREFPETIEDTIGEPIWLPGARTLLYLELNDQWRPFRVRAHSIGTTPEDDPVLYEEADDGFFVEVDLSQDRRYVVIETGDHETTEVRVVPADSPTAPARLISPRRRGHEYHVDHARNRFYVLTNDASINFRIVSAPDTDPGESAWEEVIAGRDDTYLHGFTPFARCLLVEERSNAVDDVVVYPYEGTPFRVAFPEDVHAAHEGENPEFDVTTVQVRYESMITPPTVFDLDLRTGELTQRKQLEIPSGYDRERFRTRRLFAPARDGTLVPITVVHRDDFPLDGTGYLHLSGYGAYGYGITPGFSRDELSLLDRGFAFAVAHVRGGDELGRQWYLEGKLDKRWNTFTDFIDAAHHLVAERYTAAGRICASGGSAGGELMGVVLNEAPTLWAAVAAHVPFVDVTNTMLDDTLPLTPMEWPEWGNPIDSSEAFAYIRSYSPYDNVSAQPYPPIFVTAGLNDPRVTYWEPAKWTAALRYTRTDDNVALLKTNMGAGHAGKSGRFQHLEEEAEEIAFFLLATGRSVEPARDDAAERP